MLIIKIITFHFFWGIDEGRLLKTTETELGSFLRANAQNEGVSSFIARCPFKILMVCGASTPRSRTNIQTLEKLRKLRKLQQELQKLQISQKHTRNMVQGIATRHTN